MHVWLSLGVQTLALWDPSRLLMAAFTCNEAQVDPSFVHSSAAVVVPTREDTTNCSSTHALMLTGLTFLTQLEVYASDTALIQATGGRGYINLPCRLPFFSRAVQAIASSRQPVIIKPPDLLGSCSALAQGRETDHGVDDG